VLARPANWPVWQIDREETVILGIRGNSKRVVFAVISALATAACVDGSPLQIQHANEAVPLAVQPYGNSATVSSVPFVQAVSCGAYSSYALLSDGTVRAWGSNVNGELGDGTNIDRISPVAVLGLSGVTGLAAGASASHMCAVKAGGATVCWGSNSFGQLGNGTTNSSLAPVTVSGSYVFKQIAAGTGHTCAALANGQMSCWGSNTHGQFGNDSRTSSLTPIAPSRSGVEEIQIYLATTCLRGGQQEVHCAGSNADPNGQFCTGLSSALWTPSTLRTSSELPAGLAVAGRHACELVQMDGSVRCAGENDYGQLGDGTSTNRYTAAPVMGLAGATAIAAGGAFTCALKSDGTVWCWGLNSELGQLGDRTMDDRSTPVAVYGLSQVTGISAGVNHACATKTDGTVWCWGINSQGQLGDRSTTTRAQPVQVVF
jgi:alpha-tubulin suppressor-like RCC1 family protein